MNVHISPEKIQEYEHAREAHDEAFEQGGAVRGVDQVLRLATPEQVSYAENDMQEALHARPEDARIESEFLETTEQGKRISFYLDGLKKYETVLNRSKRNAEEASGALFETQSGARAVTDADLAENAEKNAVIKFAREVQLGGFGLPPSEQFQWLRDSQARLQEMVPSLAKNPRYQSGETVTVERNAKDDHDAYFEDDWTVAAIAVSGYFLVEKGGADGMHKEAALQDLDAWNGFTPVDAPDKSAA